MKNISKRIQEDFKDFKSSITNEIEIYIELKKITQSTNTSFKNATPLENGFPINAFQFLKYFTNNDSIDVQLDKERNVFNRTDRLIKDEVNKESYLQYVLSKHMDKYIDGKLNKLYKLVKFSLVDFVKYRLTQSPELSNLTTSQLITYVDFLKENNISYCLHSSYIESIKQ